jgi:hypothetical protein
LPRLQEEDARHDAGRHPIRDSYGMFFNAMALLGSSAWDSCDCAWDSFDRFSEERPLPSQDIKVIHMEYT